MFIAFLQPEIHVQSAMINHCQSPSTNVERLEPTNLREVFANSCTVKTFGLLQPYYGHLSCIPVVYVTSYKLQANLIESLSVVEMLLLFVKVTGTSS